MFALPWFAPAPAEPEVIGPLTCTFTKRGMPISR